MKVRIVKIEFIKDQEDIRPNRQKIIPKGKILTIAGELADQYIEMGAAKIIENPTDEELNKTNRINSTNSAGKWWRKQSDTMKVGLLTISTMILLFVAARLYDRPNNSTSRPEKPPLQLKDTSVQSNEHPVLDQEKNSGMDSSIFFLQSYEPLELFDGNLMITLNGIIKSLNQVIELKLVDKQTGESSLRKDKSIGDIILFKDYTIILLALDRNISTYDLKIKVEKQKDDNNR